MRFQWKLTNLFSFGSVRRLFPAEVPLIHPNAVVSLHEKWNLRIRSGIPNVIKSFKSTNTRGSRTRESF